MRQGQPSVLVPAETGEALRSHADRIQAFTTRGRLDLAQACFGASWAQTDWVLPTNLEQFATRIGSRLGQPDAQYWVEEHTLEPFYARTLTQRRTDLLQARLARPGRGRRAPLVAFSMEEWFVPTARLCPECDDRHQSELGFSWVHRCWLLPFVTRCTEHGELLHEHPQWTPRGRGPRREREVIPWRQELGLDLARRSRNMLECEQSVLNELAGLLTSRGFKHPGGTVRRAPLVEVVGRYASGRSEHPELAWLLGTRAKLTRLLSPLWSRGKVTLHPTVALYVLDALREQPEVQPQLELELNLRERQAEQVRKWQALGEALAAAPTATQAAKSTGVSVTTAVVSALSAGLEVQLRPKVLTKAKRAQVEALLAAGKRPGQVAAATGLSPSTIYRVMRANSTVREQNAQVLRQASISHRKEVWMTLMARKPELGVAELRRLEPGVYTYLYRHARDWLQEASPAKRKPVTPAAVAGRLPSGADAVLAATIRAAGQASAHSRVTPTQLLAKGALRASSLKKVKAPGATAALTGAAESDRSYVVRRLEAAVTKVLQDGLAVTPWRVLRASGLRSTTVFNAKVRVADVIHSCRAQRMRKVAND